MGAKERSKRVGTDSVLNVSYRDIIGSKGDAAAAGAVSTTESLVAYIKQLVTAQLAELAASMGPFTVEKTDGAVLTGDDDLFVVSGGPIMAQIFGEVTTVIGANATNFDLQVDVTDPAATVDLNAAPVACEDDAVATIYMCLDSTSVFTPVTAGTVIVDHVAAPIANLLITPGTVILRSSAANTGVIRWWMNYYKISPDSLVVAAA